MRTILWPLAIAAALTLTGCGVVNNDESSQLTFDGAKAQTLSLRDEIEQTLPADAALGRSDNDVRVPCGSDAAQFDGNRTIELSSEFDRAAWLDSIAALYADRDGWTVQKDVLAGGSSDATAAVSLTSTDGYYLRFGEFSETSQGGPVVVLSASGPCVKV